MATGTITMMTAQGFGFIAPDKHAGELWMRPQCGEGRGALREGQHVEYFLAGGPAGIEAANVRPAATHGAIGLRSMQLPDDALSSPRSS